MLKEPRVLGVQVHVPVPAVYYTVFLTWACLV